MGFFVFAVHATHAMTDLNTEIKIGADASGVEAGVGRAKRSLASLGEAAAQVGQRGGKGIEGIGTGGEAAARKVEAATRNTVASIQRQIAAFEAGGTASRQYQESLARLRGVDVNALKPYLDQLDAARAKAEAATKAQSGLGGGFGDVVNQSAVAARALGVLSLAASAVFSAASIKAAVDMADQLDDLAEKSGIAVEKLSALRYAGEVTGTPLEALATGIRKLGQNMAAAAGGAKEQAAAFDAVGISITRADGSLRAQDEVLGELATRFAGYEDGAAKSALAMELFGKQGEALIPLLNQGASGIDNLRQEGEKLGAVFGSTLAKQAADFNDNLTRLRLSGEGARMTFAGELLPTLNLLTTAFLDAKDGSQSLAVLLGGGVRTVAEALVVLFSDVAFVFKAAGREIGAIAAQLVALGRLDFKGFTAISQAVTEDAQRARAELDKFQRDVLSSRYLFSQAGAGRGTAPDPRVVGSVKTDAPIVAKPQPEGPARATPVDKELAAYESLIAAIRTKVEAERAELANGGALAESQKTRIKLEEELTAGKLSLTAAHKALVLAAIGELEVLERQKKAIAAAITLDQQRLQIAQDLDDEYVAMDKARESGRAAVSAYAQSINDAAAAQQFELGLMGQTERARNQALAQYRIELDLKRQIEAIDKNAGFDEAQREVERARARAAAAIASASVSSQQFLDEWKTSVKTYDDIFRTGFADMLNRGEDRWKSFTTSLATTFKTTVPDEIYKTFAQPFVVKFVGQALGFFGGGSPAAAPGAVNGAGQALNAASTASQLAGGFNNFSSLGNAANFLGFGSGSSVFSQFATSGLGNALGLSTTVDAIGGLGTAANALTGAGTAFTAAMPYLTAALAVISLLDSKGETRFGGQYGLSLDGSVYNPRRDTTTSGSVGVNFLEGPSGGEVDGGTVRKSIQSTVDGINELLAKYGSAASVSAFTAGLEASDKGRGGVFVGGLLSTGQRFGESGQGDNYAGTLFEAGSSTADQKKLAESFATDLGTATLQALKAASSELPAFVRRELDKIADPEALGLAETQAAVAAISSLPDALLQSAGTTRDALLQTFSQGVASGNAAATGQAVAQQLLGSIETSFANQAYGQVFDVVLNEFTAPMLDAIKFGGDVSELLAADSIEATIARAEAQAARLDAIFNNPATADALERLYSATSGIVTRLSDSLGGITPRTYGAGAASAPQAPQAPTTAAFTPATASAPTPAEDPLKPYLDARRQLEIDLARAMGDTAGAYRLLTQGMGDAERAAYDENEALRERVRAATSVRGLQDSGAQLSIDLLRAQGKQEQALAAERALAIRGMTALEVATFDANQTIRDQITALQTLAESRVNALALLRQNVTGVLDTASGQTDAALAALERAAQARREALASAITDMRAVFDAASTGARALRQQNQALAARDALLARDFIAQAASTARATGYLPDQKQLANAIGSATNGLAQTVFASQAEADYQRAVLAFSLEDLADISSDQLTEAERQQKLLTDQLDAARTQLDELRGIKSGVLAFPDALNALAAALQLERNVRNQVAASTLIGSGQAVYSVGTGSGLTASGAEFRGAEARQQAIDALAAGASARDIYAVIKNSGFSLSQAERILGAGPGTLEDEARKLGLPVFHNGTAYVPRTGYALLQEGEAVIRREMNPAFNPGLLAAQAHPSRVEALLERLIARVEALEEHAATTATATSDQAFIWDKATEGGNLMRVQVMAPIPA